MSNKENAGMKAGHLHTESTDLFEEMGKSLRKEARRWPALLALIIIGGAYAILSDRLTIGPSWILIPLMALLIIPAIITRLKGNHHVNHYLLLALCCLVTLAEITSISLLLATLPDKSVAPVSLLRDAALLWTSNIIVFALWYWQVDGGGPYERSHESCNDYRQNADLLFPQLTLTEARPAFKEWRPGFMDYLFVAFNTSTAFSPTDTPVLSTSVKVLSMVQAALSLVTLAALAARAINIL
ncbi:MAG TPA: hypothetical protein VH186_02085 [Chloroflexia bacterium]|nr:hypothetical protein [Chloroflexia bacterium]